MFDEKNGFNKDGELKQGGILQQLMGTTPLDKHRKRVAVELEETEALLESIAPLDEESGLRDWEGTCGSVQRVKHETVTRVCAGKSEEALNEQDRHTLIWEQHRLDRLSFVARRIYLLNALELDDNPLKPIKLWQKSLGLLAECGFVFGMSFWLMAFAATVGKYVCTARARISATRCEAGAPVSRRPTSISFTINYVVGTLQDLCLFVPAVLFVQNLFLPMVVRDEVREKHHDMSSSDDQIFKKRFAAGAAARVAVLDFKDSMDSRNPDSGRKPRQPLVVSRMIVEANRLYELVPGYEQVSTRHGRCAESDAGAINAFSPRKRPCNGASG
jgi:hypothetical protein